MERHTQILQSKLILYPGGTPHWLMQLLDSSTVFHFLGLWLICHLIALHWRGCHYILCHRPFIATGSQRRETLRAAESISRLCRRRPYLCPGDSPRAAGEDKVRERTDHWCQHGKHIVRPPAWLFSLSQNWDALHKLQPRQRAGHVQTHNSPSAKTSVPRFMCDQFNSENQATQ